MHILTVINQGSWMPTNLSEGWRRLGCSVEEFFYGTHMGKAWSSDGLRENRELNAKLLSTARRLKAEGRLDLIFAVIYDDVLAVETARQLRALDVPMVNYHVDLVGQWYRVLRTGKYFDRVACAQTDHWAGLQRAGVRPYYMPMAANPPLLDEHAPQGRIRFNGALYLGSPWLYRCQVLNYLAEQGVALSIYGHNWLRRTPDPANAQHWLKNLHDLHYYAWPRLREESRYDLLEAIRVRFRMMNLRPNALISERLIDCIKGPYANGDFIPLVQGAGVNLGFTHFQGAPGTPVERRQVRLREFEIPMVGGFYLTQDCTQLRELFRIGEHVETWQSMYELKDKIRYYLNHPGEAQQIARAGQAHCLQEHTWANRFRGLLRELNIDPPCEQGYSQKSSAPIPIYDGHSGDSASVFGPVIANGRKSKYSYYNQRVLIISPHFPPVNAPDHQRIRMSLPYFQEFGWEPFVLTVHPEFVEAFTDPLLEKMVPSDVKVIRTGAWPVAQTRKVGIGSLALRALTYMMKAGDRLIVEEKIDLVYFSTTVFPVMALGPAWYDHFGVPYVIDFQDPWLSDYYNRAGAPKPPGGRIKYGISQGVARILEPYTMRKVSHAISVSPAYSQMLLNRYPWLREDQFTVLPFGAAEKEFEYLPKLNVRQTIFDPRDGKRHWVYVGRAGHDMALALRILFLALRTLRERDPNAWDSVRLHFIGTDYATGSRAMKTVEPIARELGVDDIVEEHPHRVPYFEALQIKTDSDAIILIGSDDAGYTASKLYPCILARRPILAVFHQQSSVVEILRRCNAGRAITFCTDDSPEVLLDSAMAQLQWLLSLPKGYAPETNWKEFQPYTAKEMTRRQCEIFDQCLVTSNRS